MTVPHPKFQKFFAALSDRRLLSDWRGEVHRQALPRYLSKPYRLTGVGAVLFGGRWNGIRLIPAVYASVDLDTLHAEFRAKAHRFGWAPKDFEPSLVITMKWKLERMVNLTDAAVLKALGVTKRDLQACDWEADQLAGRESLTQAIGRAAFEQMATGLLVPSVQNKKGGNIVLFPSHLVDPSILETLHEKEIPFSHGI